MYMYIYSSPPYQKADYPSNILSPFQFYPFQRIEGLHMQMPCWWISTPRFYVLLFTCVSFLVLYHVLHVYVQGRRTRTWIWFNTCRRNKCCWFSNSWQSMQMNICISMNQHGKAKNIGLICIDQSANKLYVLLNLFRTFLDCSIYKFNH